MGILFLLAYKQETGQSVCFADQLTGFYIKNIDRSLIDGRYTRRENMEGPLGYKISYPDRY